MDVAPFSYLLPTCLGKVLGMCMQGLECGEDYSSIGLMYSEQALHLQELPHAVMLCAGQWPHTTTFHAKAIALLTCSIKLRVEISDILK